MPRPRGAGSGLPGGDSPAAAQRQEWERLLWHGGAGHAEPGLPEAGHRLSPAGGPARRAQRRCPSPPGRPGQQRSRQGTAAAHPDTADQARLDPCCGNGTAGPTPCWPWTTGSRWGGSALPPSRRLPATSPAPTGPGPGSSASIEEEAPLARTLPAGRPEMHAVRRLPPLEGHCGGTAGADPR